MACTVISYEITSEKCICVSGTIVRTVPPSDICKYECLREVIVVTDPFLLRYIGSDGNVYLLTFKLSSFY